MHWTINWIRPSQAALYHTRPGTPGPGNPVWKWFHWFALSDWTHNRSPWQIHIHYSPWLAIPSYHSGFSASPSVDWPIKGAAGHSYKWPSVYPAIPKSYPFASPTLQREWWLASREYVTHGQNSWTDASLPDETLPVAVSLSAPFSTFPSSGDGHWNNGILRKTLLSAIVHKSGKHTK